MWLTQLLYTGFMWLSHSHAPVDTRLAMLLALVWSVANLLRHQCGELALALCNEHQNFIPVLFPRHLLVYRVCG